ncbi:hypothetical protein [Lapidilactobacillus bayanensis]|uniref:hypothetical protein n=1 Tax=Lapidilactobacillus bayanensis TaxID=2485998 RepID=UPI000F78416E|nr:hypothetical protein [Lapidilactobacillus bayanensis]
MQANLLLPLFSKQARRYQAIYYLLTGKRTVSNLSAGLAYQLLPYFHFYPKLSQDDYQAALQQLVEQHYAKIQATDKTIQLTSLGQVVQARLLQRGFWPTTYNYWQDGDWQLQWERLLLSVQVISNYQHHHAHYTPLATQPLVQNEIRHWFYRCGRTQQQQFVEELSATTAQLTPNQANLLVNSLRSSSYPGVSDFQLSLSLSLTASELILARVTVLSAFLRKVQQFPQSAPLRQVFQFPTTILSLGSTRTYELWRSGQPWSEIVQHSYQKESTLLEHLLEAAILMPDFDFDQPRLQQLVAANPESYFGQRLLEIQELRQGVQDD